MSVLVKGMKMPKSCATCQFRISYDESVDPFTEYCYITNERLGYFNNKQAKWKKERRKSCPLDEVTEEVRHGWWEHLGGDEWFCTACAHVITTEGSWEKPWQKYCESCGAKMDEVNK